MLVTLIKELVNRKILNVSDLLEPYQNLIGSVTTFDEFCILEKKVEEAGPKGLFVPQMTPSQLNLIARLKNVNLTKVDVIDPHLHLDFTPLIEMIAAAWIEDHGLDTDYRLIERRIADMKSQQKSIIEETAKLSMLKNEHRAREVELQRQEAFLKQHDEKLSQWEQELQQKSLTLQQEMERCQQEKERLKSWHQDLVEKDSALLKIQEDLRCRENAFLERMNVLQEQERYLREATHLERLLHDSPPEGMDGQKADADPLAISSLLNSLRGSPADGAEIMEVHKFFTEYGWDFSFLANFLRECFKRGLRRSFQYRAMARRVFDAGVPESDLPSFINSQSDNRNRKVEEVLVALGLRRTVTETALTFYQKWTEDWSIEHDLVLKACELTVANAASPSLKYADKILERWRLQGIINLDAYGT